MQRTEGEEPARTWPADGNATGDANPKCYAQCLGDCPGKVTREHYVSENILNQIRGLIVSRLPWQKPGESKQLTPSTLLARILCERHNNCLSDLDNRIGELFAVLRRLADCINRKGEDDFRSLAIHKAFWGRDLERWMLKYVLGCVYSGNASHAGQQIPRGQTIPDGQVRALFTQDPWPGVGALHGC